MRTAAPTRPASRPDHVPCARHRPVYHEAFPHGEELLQFVWEARLFDVSGLRTTDGHAVEVIHPGRVQHDAGPDLRDARLRIDGQEWAGTVEVHVRSSEWARHGHQRDPAYDNVVLHVVHTADAEVRTLSGRRIPQVALAPRLDAAALARHADLMRARLAVPCAPHIGGGSRSQFDAWLGPVLQERLLRRTRDAAALHALLGGDNSALAWHLLCRAFGQRANAEGFAMLAHALPWRVLRRVRDDAFRVEALVFGQAGLLEGMFADTHPRLLQAEHRAMVRLHGLRAIPSVAWTFGRLRPGAFPTVRLAQLAALVHALPAEPAALAAIRDIAQLRRYLTAAPSAYWGTHYRFDRPAPPRSKVLSGSMVDQLVVNAVVPLLLVLGRVRGDAGLRDRAIDLLDRLPAERNARLDAWQRLGIIPGNAARGQALLELGRMYCAQHRCLSCGFGQHLLGHQRP